MAAQLGCGKKPDPAENAEPRAAPTSADAIPTGPVAGRIAGKPFALKGARYTTDVRPGHEHTDIVLADTETRDPCGDLGPGHATSVWLRWTGSGFPPEGVARIGPKQPGAWEAHYEGYDSGKWTGNGNSSMLLSLRSTRADRKLEGDVSACFGDGSDSCVAGNFVARFCPVRMDAPVRGASALEPMPDGGWAPPEPEQKTAPVPSASALPGENLPPG